MILHIYKISLLNSSMISLILNKILMLYLTLGTFIQIQNQNRFRTHLSKIHDPLNDE